MLRLFSHARKQKPFLPKRNIQTFANEHDFKKSELFKKLRDLPSYISDINSESITEKETRERLGLSSTVDSNENKFLGFRGTCITSKFPYVSRRLTCPQIKKPFYNPSTSNILFVGSSLYGALHYAALSSLNEPITASSDPEYHNNLGIALCFAKPELTQEIGKRYGIEINQTIAWKSMNGRPPEEVKIGLEVGVPEEYYHHLKILMIADIKGPKREYRLDEGPTWHGGQRCMWVQGIGYFGLEEPEQKWGISSP